MHLRHLFSSPAWFITIRFICLLLHHSVRRPQKEMLRKAVGKGACRGKHSQQENALWLATSKPQTG